MYYFEIFSLFVCDRCNHYSGILMNHSQCLRDLLTSKSNLTIKYFDEVTGGCDMKRKRGKMRTKTGDQCRLFR